MKNPLFRLAHFQFIKKIHLGFLKFAASNGVAADLWYLVTGEFRREHKAVLAGRLLHKNGLTAEDTTVGAYYTLRRNTHRLEKGLIMRPRRPIFALDFIGQTVQFYKSLTTNDEASKDYALTLSWAHDVLNSYFGCVDLSNEVIAKAKSVFDSCAETDEDSKRRPYVRDLEKGTNISVDDLHELAVRRRSCRWFQPDPVPRELIDRAIEVGTLAPSACNRQPFEFRIFDDPELAQKVGAIPGGTTGFFQNFPGIAVLVGEWSAFPADRDRHLPYIDASLAAMGFQFALEVQGISSCCINWPDIESRERAIQKALDLGPNHRVIMLIAFGYPAPDTMVPYSQKKPLEEIRRYQTHVS